jgi:excisionase family DNA binding protein
MTERYENNGAITIAEAASILRVSRRTIERYIGAGSLRSTKLPGGLVRLSRAEVDALLPASSSGGDAA